MSRHPTRRQALTFAVAATAAAVLAEVGRPRKEASAGGQVPLERIFPRAFSSWQIDGATDSFVRPANEQGKLYGVYDQMLERAYVDTNAERIMLSVAYGTEQSAGLQVHRPEVCYAGGGFKIEGLHRAELALGASKLPVTRLFAAMPGRPEPITYWLVLGESVMRDPDSFRWRQLSFGLRGRILDGMVVRVSSIDRNRQRAYLAHARFVGDLYAALDAAYRSRVMGTGSSD